MLVIDDYGGQWLEGEQLSAVSFKSVSTCLATYSVDTSTYHLEDDVHQWLSRKRQAPSGGNVSESVESLVSVSPLSLASHCRP